MITFDYYHGLLQKYVSLFGSLFNNIYIDRLDNANNVVGSMKVPIEYGDREKYLARLSNDPNLDRGYAVKLPVMSYEITGFDYDSSRKIGTPQNIAIQDGSIKSGYSRVAVPVPYTMTFRLTVYTNRAEDGFRVVEQILPMFTPEWTFSAKIMSEMPLYSFNIPITLSAVTNQDLYTGDFKERRAVTWTLEFSMNVLFFGPVTQSGIIKQVIVNMYTDLPKPNIKPDAIITVQPGLTANGQPTESANNSIPLYEINEDDNYGYVINIQEPFSQ